MSDVFLKAFSLIFFIFLGYFFKRIGLVKQSEFTLLSRIVLKLTLPCAVIVNLNGAHFAMSMLLLTLFGIVCGVILMICGYFFYAKRGNTWQSFGLLNMAGYNIGNFAMPFIQGFLGTAGMMAVGLFDIGNSVIVLGGSYSIAGIVHNKNKVHTVKAVVRRIGGNMLTSIPFLSYLLMGILAVIGISIPAPVISVAQIGANANPFLSMFMLGVAFRTDSLQEKGKEIAGFLAVRFGISILLAVCFWFFTPFVREVREALVLLVLAPIGSAAPPFTALLQEDYTLAGTINSLSVLVSIVLMLVAVHLL